MGAPMRALPRPSESFPRFSFIVASACLLLTAVFATSVAHGASISRTATQDGTWTQFATPQLVESVESGASVYDPVRSRIIMFGGYGTSLPQNHVWTLSLSGPARWTQLSPLGTPPPGRYGHSMVYDSARDRLLVFGGTADGILGFSDVWELTLSGTPAWHALTTVNPPPGRFAHVAIY